MADAEKNEATSTAPPLQVVTETTAAVAKAKEEIRAELKKEVTKGIVVSVVLGYLLTEGPNPPRWLKRLLG